jgi:hypothetical protein
VELHLIVCSQQEWLLSSRRLYFTDVQVYFECKTALYNEDPWVLNSDNGITPRESGSEGNIKFSQTESPNRWIRFRTLLEDYVSRDLSYNDDIFNACTGIYQSVYGSDAKRFLFGLPESNFIEALRWDVFRYDRAFRLPERKDFILPSWSWASYDGHMRWFRGDGYTSSSTDEEGPAFCNLVSFKICLDTDQGYTQVELSDQEDDEELPVNATKRYLEPVGTHHPLPGRLVFRTQSTLLELEGDFGYLREGRQYHSLQVVDKDGFHPAEINVPLQWALSNVKRESYSRGRQFQFIAISAIFLPSHWTISHLDDYVSKKDASVVDELEKYFEYWEKIEGYGKDRDFTDIIKWHNAAEGKHLHVMLVESHGDACRRIGITSMRLESWLSTSPKLEDIVLE